MQWLDNNTVHLAYVDIQMSDINGMEWARLTKGKVMHIFTTAYEEFAIESYKVNAIDYLLKPFYYTDFYEASLKALNVATKKNEVPAIKEYFFVKCGYQNRRFFFEEIKYIKASVDYVEIYNNEKPILANISLREIENQLPSTLFIRVHRSYIVNISKIEAIERGVIIIENERIPISERYLNELKKIVSNSEQ